MPASVTGPERAVRRAGARTIDGGNDPPGDRDVGCAAGNHRQRPRVPETRSHEADEVVPGRSSADLTDRIRNGAEGPLLDDPPERRLVRSTGGGFGISCSAGAAIRVESGDESRVLSGPDDRQGWTLRDAGNGFVLCRPGGEEVARLSREPGARAGEAVGWILREDGALFRVRPCGVSSGRYELTGWEVSGAYFAALATGDDWRIVAEPAGAGLRDVVDLMILFGAEILAAEEHNVAGGAADGES